MSVKPHRVVGGIMVGVGSLHFVAAGFLEPTLPRWVPFKREVIYGSGVVEVACGAGLLANQRWAAKAAAVTLAAIWPANIQMALDAGDGVNGGLADNATLMWARVPLQLPLIWAALQAGKD